MDEDTLLRLCSTAFTSEEIKRSKSLLLEALPKDYKITQRKGEGKELRDLSDIVQVLKTTDPDAVPVFVARQLDKLPAITFDHLDCTRLLRDIVKLQDDVNVLKLTSATSQQLDELKVQLTKTAIPSRLSVCNVNTNRGGWCLDSGPIGISDLHNSTLNDTDNAFSNSKSMRPEYRSILLKNNNHSTISKVKVPQNKTSHKNNDFLTQPQSASPLPTVTSRVTVDSSPSAPLREDTSADKTGSNTMMYGPIDNNESEWQLVRRRNRKTNHLRKGQMGIAACDSAVKFKAAERKIPIFITNVHNDTNEADIISYIRTKTREVVSLEKVNIKRQSQYKAYKFFVNQNSVELFLDKNLWPQGIIFRKFVNFKYKTTHRVNPVDGTSNVK
ncbi:uncharacterized protein LOC113229730 [Hyposmocoma kahamanoa]|uniref:uncharacterized protein LOC113229730 n=1 Tax=Hyposmocoma kahamanoa TaxID=1477025 RepID=UPI000E6D8EB7|nr:uncharacterized protein LOC113229730 [Hyposmocoma kahamanoa]